MQPYADVNLLCEEWNGWTDTWYRRSRIVTRTIRGCAYITDPYFLTISKSYEYYMAMMVWCICEVPDVHHAVHPYTYFRELAPKDYKRRLSGCTVQANAPLNVTDLVRVEPPVEREGEPTLWRKRTQGKLAGFYAALALSKRAFVTYRETEAQIATSETRSVRFPLPPGAKLKAVEMVTHNGAVRPCRAEPIDTDDGPGLEMRVQDCALTPLYYRVRYRLRQ